MQGSPAANLILAYALNDMVEHVRGDCRLFLYSDNVVLLAKSEGAAAEGEHALRLYLGSHPYGPFVLEGAIEIPEQGFEALGYGFRRNSLTGEVMVDLSDAAWRRLNFGLKQAIDLDRATGTPGAGAARDFIQAKFSGYRAVDDWEGLKAHFLEEADFHVRDAA